MNLMLYREQGYKQKGKHVACEKLLICKLHLNIYSAPALQDQLQAQTAAD